MLKIFGLGIPELVIILVVVLLIFGPKNLPKLGSAIGKAVKGLRDGMGSNKNATEEGAEEVVVEESDADAPELTEVEAAAAAAEEPENQPKVVKRVVKKKVVAD